MSVVELKAQDFTPERFGEFFQVALMEAGLWLNEPHFFATFKNWLEMGLARAWWNDGCMLGAIFTADVFSKKLRGQVVFWFSAPEVRHTPVTGAVFRAFEAAAREAGCADIQAASYTALDPIRRSSGHLEHGFRKTETIYTKELH